MYQAFRLIRPKLPEQTASSIEQGYLPLSPPVETLSAVLCKIQTPCSAVQKVSSRPEAAPRYFHLWRFQKLSPPSDCAARRFVSAFHSAQTADSHSLCKTTL